MQMVVAAFVVVVVGQQIQDVLNYNAVNVSS